MRSLIIIHSCVCAIRCTFHQRRTLPCTTIDLHIESRGFVTLVRHDQVPEQTPFAASRATLRTRSKATHIGNWCACAFVHVASKCVDPCKSAMSSLRLLQAMAVHGGMFFVAIGSTMLCHTMETGAMTGQDKPTRTSNQSTTANRSKEMSLQSKRNWGGRCV